MTEDISMDEVEKLSEELVKWFNAKDIEAMDALDFLTSFMLSLVTICFEGGELQAFDKIAVRMRVNLVEALKVPPLERIQ